MPLPDLSGFGKLFMESFWDVSEAFQYLTKGEVMSKHTPELLACLKDVVALVELLHSPISPIDLGPSKAAIRRAEGFTEDCFHSVDMIARELLAALKLLYACIHGDEDRCGCRELARSALAKAEGRDA